MKNIAGRCKLLLATTFITLIWTVLLPRISTWQPIESMIRAHRDAGVDPSAMFYSDLEHLTYRDGMLRRRD
jgi:hypothetical protein